MKATLRVLIVLTLASLISLSLLQRSPATKAAWLDLSGEINGAPYRIRVPENWNGTLLVFAHGYRDKADHPGEVDNRNAEVAPNAALEAPLLAQGYALAGSAYKDNGWDVEDAIQDTKDLTVFFGDTIAKPEHTILWGVSLGTFVELKSVERFGGIYDGVLCACGSGAGATRNWDSGVPAVLAYDILFGMPGTWGTVGEVRNDLDFETEVFPRLLSEVSNPVNFPKFE